MSNQSISDEKEEDEEESSYFCNSDCLGTITETSDGTWICDTCGQITI